MATGPTPLDPTPAGPTPITSTRARRAPDVYAPSLDSLRPFRSALDRRSSKVLGMVADPSTADALATEHFALADAHPKLGAVSGHVAASGAHPR